MQRLGERECALHNELAAVFNIAPTLALPLEILRLLPTRFLDNQEITVYCRELTRALNQRVATSLPHKDMTTLKEAVHTECQKLAPNVDRFFIIFVLAVVLLLLLIAGFILKLEIPVLPCYESTERAAEALQAAKQQELQGPPAYAAATAAARAVVPRFEEKRLDSALWHGAVPTLNNMPHRDGHIRSLSEVLKV